MLQSSSFHGICKVSQNKAVRANQCQRICRDITFCLKRIENYHDKREDKCQKQDNQHCYCNKMADFFLLSCFLFSSIMLPPPFLTNVNLSNSLRLRRQQTELMLCLAGTAIFVSKCLIVYVHSCHYRRVKWLTFCQGRFTSYTIKHLVIVKKRHCTKRRSHKWIVTLMVARVLVQPSIWAASHKALDTLINPAT